MFDDGHLAENFAGGELRKDAADVGADKAGDFHQPVLHKIDTVAGVAFLENIPAGGEPAFLRDEPQRLQFLAIKAAKNGDGFESDHKINVLEKIAA
jgi:hypothetical protein